MDTEIKITDFLSKDRIDAILKHVLDKKQLIAGIADSKGRVVFSSRFCSKDITNALEVLLPNLKEKDCLTEDECIYESGRLFIKIYPIYVNTYIAGYFFASSYSKGEIVTEMTVLSLMYGHIKDIIYYKSDLNSLSSEIVKNYESIAILYEIASNLSISLNIEDICRVIVEHIMKVIPVKNISILLLDDKEGKLKSTYSVGIDGKKNPEFSIGRDKGITGYVISTKSPLIECKVSENPIFVPVSYPISSLLSAPMIARGKIIGAINLSDKVNGKEFLSSDLKLLNSIASASASSIDNSILFSDVRELFWSLVSALVSAIDAKDKYTCGHSKRVAEITINIAKETGVSEKELDHVYLAALLHDIGKIGISEKILFKADRLSEEEWREIKKHPQHASNILNGVKQFEKVEKWVKHEHERFDGLGYPDQLRGEDIPLASRIIAIADAFDAMTSDRAYRRGMSHEKALEIIKKSTGAQFDPDIYQAFLSAYNKGCI